MNRDSHCEGIAPSSGTTATVAYSVATVWIVWIAPVARSHAMYRDPLAGPICVRPGYVHKCTNGHARARVRVFICVGVGLGSIPFNQFQFRPARIHCNSFYSIPIKKSIKCVVNSIYNHPIPNPAPIHLTKVSHKIMRLMRIRGGVCVCV